MLEEVTPLAVIAPVGYIDLLAIHVILNLMVPHSLPMRMIPVDSLQRDPGTRREERSASNRGFKRTSANLCLWSDEARRVKTTNAT